MRNWIGHLAAACATALLVACNTEPRNETGIGVEDDAAIGTAGISGDDRDFVEESLASGMAEVQLGELARDRASSEEVRQFAQMMVRDHTQSGEQLKQIAQQHSLTVPAAIDDEHQELRERLSGLSGAEFDREYMDAMVQSHEDVMDRLESRTDPGVLGGPGTSRPGEGNDAVEASINQWAAGALPTVRQHLEEARRISETLDSQRNNSTR